MNNKGKLLLLSLVFFNNLFAATDEYVIPEPQMRKPRRAKLFFEAALREQSRVRVRELEEKEREEINKTEKRLRLQINFEKACFDQQVVIDSIIRELIVVDNLINECKIRNNEKKSSILATIKESAANLVIFKELVVKRIELSFKLRREQEKLSDIKYE